MTLATISDGAAITFSILSGIAGIVLGALIRETHASDTVVASEWGEIDQAATEAYEGAHVKLLVTCDAVPQGQPLILDETGFEAYAGVSQAEILRRLIPA